MATEKYRVVKVTVKTGCDTEQATVKSNLSYAKATSMRDTLESSNEKVDFDPHSMVSYLVQQVGSNLVVGSHPAW